MESDLVYAADIGGTKIDMGIVDDSGKILIRKVASTPAFPLEAVDLIIINYHYLLGKLNPNKEIKAIGMGAPNIRGGKYGGFFEEKVVHLPEYRNFDLEEKLKEHFDIPIAIENDADAATFGAFQHFNPQALPFLYLTVSTGTGGGLLIPNANNDPVLYRGVNDEHPEFGHMPFSGQCKKGRKKVTIGCGMENCLDSYVGGNGILARYGVKPEDADEDIKKEVAINLAKGIYTISLFYGPKVVCLGGGVAIGWGTKFINLTSYHLHKLHSLSPLMSCPELYISTLGSDTGLLGAAAVGLMNTEKR